MELTYWYLFPIAIGIAWIANGAGIGGATFFSPLFILALGPGRLRGSMPAMARIPMPPVGPNRDPTLSEYFKPWAWGLWTATCFTLGVIGESPLAWLGAGLLWAIPVAWASRGALRRRRANQEAHAALLKTSADSVSGWWRSRHLWFDDLQGWERRLLERLERAELYFESVPVSGWKGFLHRREMRRRISEIRYLIGTKGRAAARHSRREKIQKRMKDLSQVLDLEIDAAIADDIANSDTIAQLREVIAELNATTTTSWENEPGETFR